MAHKALVLSGGGSKGAFTGGMLQHMKMDLGMDYDTYLGTSTGSLLQTLASINDFENLKTAYTSITLDDIYTSSPFSKSKDPEKPKMNIFGIIKQILFKKQPTFGDSHALKELIYRFLPEDKFNEMKEKNKNALACVTNISTAQTELYSSMDVSYDEFVDWTWISCNATPFTSLVKRGKYYYVDGGFTEHMPIRRAIEMGATHIDAISTQPKEFPIHEDDFSGDPFALIGRLFEVSMWESAKLDLEVVQQMALERDVKLNVYYMPRQLTANPMYFDQETMIKWWAEGYEHAKDIFSNNMTISNKIKSTIKHQCVESIKLKKSL